MTGTASLSGLLNLSLVNGFTPTNGEMFVILTSTGLMGEFTNNSIDVGGYVFNVEYSPSGFANDVVIVGNPAVPEPASLVMISLGAVGIGLAVARSKRNARRSNLA